MNYQERAKRILQRIDELASFSEEEACLTRTYGTKAFIAARNKVEQWMEEAGLQTRVDNIGNIRGRLLSKYPKAKTFVIASHIDTVVNAGKFDGPLGVLLGLDLLEQVISSKKDLPFHLELIGFCDEEGCRFHTTYLGSKVVAGCLEPETVAVKDAAGISLGEVIRQNGGNIYALERDAIERNDWMGYFEIHIEQGPILYEKQIPVGLVAAIAGQYRAGIVFKGEAGHAGTVPMNMRRDALACAAEFILAAEHFAKTNHGLRATIGKLQVTHPASNVIPGKVICSLDLRSAEEEILLPARDTLRNIAEDICRKRNCMLEWTMIQQSKPVTCDHALNKMLARSIKEAGFELVELVSGAGHDAVPISEVAPVAMLFVKCFKGISHNPVENTEAEDIAAAMKVSDNFIQELIHHHSTTK